LFARETAGPARAPPPRRAAVEQRAVAQLRVLQQLGRGADREAGDRVRLRAARHLLGRQGLGPFGHAFLQFEEVAAAFDARAAQRRVLRPVGMAQQRHPAVPLVLLARRDHHPALRAGEYPGQAAGGFGAFPLHPAAGEGAFAPRPVRQPLERDVGVEIVAGQVDMRRLAAGLRDQQTPHRGHRAGDADGERAFVVGARERAARLRVVDGPRHVPGERGAVLQREIRRRAFGQRAGAAERRHRQDDEMGMPGLQRRRVQPERRQPRRRLAFDQDRGVGQQRVQPVAMGGGRQIERDAALARIDVGEQRAGLGSGLTGPERFAGAQAVAARRLDLEDVGADVAQDAAAERRRDPLAPFDDTGARDQHSRFPFMQPPARLCRPPRDARAVRRDRPMQRAPLPITCGYRIWTPTRRLLRLRGEVRQPGRGGRP
jgi:hypothetical protein